MTWLAARVRLRLFLALAGMLVALGAVAAVDTPAFAAPPGCVLGQGHSQVAGSYIWAYRYWFCDDGNDIPLSVNIDQYQSPGVWLNVASGSGETTYYCNGSAFNRYRTTGTTPFDILCG